MADNRDGDETNYALGGFSRNFTSVNPLLLKDDGGKAESKESEQYCKEWEHAYRD